MKSTIFILLSVFLLGCDHKADSKKSNVKAIDSQVKSKPLNHSVAIDSINLKSLIKGKWAALKDTALMLSIGNGEIFYYDASASYPYSISKGQIQIKYSDYSYVGQIAMIGKDTMIMKGVDKFKGESDTLHRCF